MIRSESKVLVGEKRTREEVEENPDLFEKCTKMRDLESVFRSEERRTSNIFRSDNYRDTSITIDLNMQSSDIAINGINNNGVHKVNKLPSSKRQGIEKGITSKKLKGINFDLNAGDFSSSNIVNNYGHQKSKNEPECVSSNSKDPMKVWKEMKQNGFLSSNHGGVPNPKKRGRKSKKDLIKNKIELAKKEQVDRFAKIAAPSGLLNELNPGIINHVRNSKQVRSIIEALVESEKQENQSVVSKEEDQLVKRETKGFLKLTGFGSHRINQAQNKPVSFISKLTCGDDEDSMAEMKAPKKLSCFSILNLDKEEDDLLELKLSSSTAMASENNSSLSNEDSTNLTSVTSLSINAATVASQWLELLHQDIKGRLSALRRSKKRVRSAIQTELPILLSKEFPPLNNDHSYNLSADAHCSRWTALFEQMDKTLSEEENQLGNWLNQIREVRVHCDQGLLKFNDIYALQQSVPTDIQFRLNKSEISEGDSAVQAAAASIYSTCNFLSSKENLPCG